MNHDELTAKLEELEELVKAGSDYERAEQQARELLLLAPGMQEIHIRILIALSTSLQLRGFAHDAKPYLEQALDLCVKHNCTDLQAICLGSIGAVYRDLSDYPRALEYCSTALRLHEELEDKSGVARVAGFIGVVYSSLSDNPRALEYHQKALALYEELGNKNGVAASTGNIGIVYADLSDYPHALEYFHKALSLNEELGNQRGVAANTSNIGNVYISLADYPHALEYFHKALSLNEELGNKGFTAVNSGNIGSVYLTLSDYPRALEYHQKALNIYKELGNKRGVAAATGNIGVVYSKDEEYSKALEYLEDALGFFREINEKRVEATFLVSIGDCYLNQKDFINARKYFVESLELRREIIHSHEGVAATLIALGKVENAEGNLGEAVQLFTEAAELAQRLGEKENEKKAHEELYAIFAHKESYKDAFIHLHRFFELNNEINLEEARKKAEYIDYERAQAEREKHIAAERAFNEATTNLLHKVLPPSIAKRLIQGEKVADYFERVTILFADIVGFTPLSANMPAHVVVRFLNHVFAVFDSIMKTHGCEKIKTIGDGYMAVAGAPVPCEDHAERMARAALAMQEDIMLPDEVREYLDEGTVFNVRIGIHTGSAVGGIIGDERFVYDIYSDAVNTASRIESTGEPGRIHLSSDFAMHLENRMNMNTDLHEFKLVKRGQTEIKGKGMMRTYFLERAE